MPETTATIAGPPQPATLEQLTEFLRIAAFECGDERPFSTPRTDAARENAIVAAYARIRRSCDDDLPGEP